MPDMELKTYFDEKKSTRKAFCSAVGIHYQHLNNLLRKERNPSPALALRIEQATNGAVTRMELLYPEQKEKVA